MAAITGPGGPSTASKIAVDGLGGPLAAGDQLRRDSTLQWSRSWETMIWYYE